MAVGFGSAACGLYFLVVTLLSKDRGQSVRDIIVNISKVLTDSPNADVMYSFKISGEPTVLVVVNATKSGINSIEDRIWLLGNIHIQSQPIIPEDDFAKQLGVNKSLFRPVGDILDRDYLYYLNLKLDYPGLTTAQFLANWKTHIEQVYQQRNQGILKLIFYKNFAERELQTFINVPEPAQTDYGLFQFPQYQVLRSGVQLQAKAIQRLSEYVQSPHRSK